MPPAKALVNKIEWSARLQPGMREKVAQAAEALGLEYSLYSYLAYNDERHYIFEMWMDIGRMPRQEHEEGEMEAPYLTDEERETIGEELATAGLVEVAS